MPRSTIPPDQQTSESQARLLFGPPSGDVIVSRASAPAASGADVGSRDQQKRKKSQVEATRVNPEPLLPQPLSLEQSHMRDREMISARDRALVNAERVTQECDPYIDEGNLIKRRIAVLIYEIDRITLQLGHIFRRSNKKEIKRIRLLQRLYHMERIQKKEELMRLYDRLSEINKIIKSILRKYEDMRRFTGVGGAHARTHRHKWSLKYKRSIDCNHPKGFSQKQHCNYGRKNMTVKK